MIKIRRGLNLPIAGAPGHNIEEGPAVRTVGVVGFDYHGLRPTMEVKVGDRVRAGQLLFTDKKTSGVRYTSPASGTVSAINRGYQRVLQSVVVDVDGEDAIGFKYFNPEELKSLSREQVVDNLVESGQWTAFRTRPFSKVPAIDALPKAIFVNCMDTQPLAIDPEQVLAERKEEFLAGLQVISTLTEGKVWVCHAGNSKLEKSEVGNICYRAFSGKHPAGNSGTHIHFLDPVGAGKSVWTINYQDTIAVGALFLTGKLDTSRVISLAGPQVSSPKLIRTRVGANLEELSAGQLRTGETRLISGSVLGGRATWKGIDYLGRYHLQVSALQEGRERPFLHYMVPGFNRHSLLPIYISSLSSNKKFSFTTSANGSERAMVPIGSYEKVMPLDILPTQLLRALIVGDTETAQNLGCLELEEEDLALCTYVCAGKYEYGPLLRDNLERIEKEG